MKFVADESVDYQIVVRLREDGHEVSYVAERDSGISDDVVLAQARREDAILLTSDKDFGELVFRQRLVNNGVLLLRIAGLSQNAKADLVSEALLKHENELPQSFSVLTPTTIRVRRQTF